MERLTTAPWPTTLNPDLNRLYYAHSANKIVAPIVEDMLEDDILPDTAAVMLAQMAQAMYGEKWRKDYEAHGMDYDPITNYDKTETVRTVRTPDLQTDSTRTPNITDNETRTPNLQTESTRTPNLNRTEIESPAEQTIVTDTKPELTNTSETTTHGDKTSTTTGGQTVTRTYTDLKDTNSKQGFNATAMQAVDQKVTTGSYSDATTYPGTGQQVKEEQGNTIVATTVTSSQDGKTTQRNTVNESGSKTTAETGNEKTVDKTTGTDSTQRTTTGNERTLTTETGTDTTVTENKTKGNIGVTTTQQMLESEYVLNEKYIFFMGVMDDIDKLFTINMY